MQRKVLLQLLSLWIVAISPIFAQQKFGLGCLPEPKGAFSGVAKYSINPAKLKNLRAMVDNSTSAYFPPIRSQGSQGSCSAWASTYYYLGYLQRQDKNWTADDNSQLMSPAYSYNQLRSDSDGSTISDYMRFFTRLGACTWSDMPYNASDDNTQPQENDFRNAAEFRTLGWSYFHATTDDELAILKSHLNDGNIAVTSMSIYANMIFTDSSGTEHEYGYSFVPGNANVLTGNSGSYMGGHAITIVGYDDDKAYGNGNKGAFKIANSWGTSWGNSGFFWVSYEFFKTNDNHSNHQWNDDNNVYIMWDRESYTPKAYATIRFTHTKREQIRFAIGIKDGSTEVYRYYYYGNASPDRVSNNMLSPYMYYYCGGEGILS